MCRLRRLGCEHATVSVEFAALLPFVAVAMLLVVQIALVVGSQLVVVHAAREGAREAAVWNDDAKARDAALRAGRLDAARTTVDVAPDERFVGDPVGVTVRYDVPLVVPLVQRFVPDTVELSATVWMRTEREPPPPSPEPPPDG